MYPPTDELILITDGRVFVTMKEVLEYNLVEIDFNWEWDYIPSDDVISHFVADDSTIDAFAKTPEIEYDENNIPKGNSKIEIKMREKIIRSMCSIVSLCQSNKKAHRRNDEL